MGPVRYRAELTIVPDQVTFTGAVEIDLQFAKSTAVLWLNAEKLTVKDATLPTGNEKLAVKVIREPKDYVGFAFDDPVGPGQATLRVAYRGEISRKDQQGIFQMKDGDRWYVYSQFEQIWARRAFPCFDEPSYKVPWELTLRVKKEQVALSNAPIVSETDTGDGMKAVKFAETSPLPSYLVAVVRHNRISSRKHLDRHLLVDFVSEWKPVWGIVWRNGLKGGEARLPIEQKSRRRG